MIKIVGLKGNINNVDNFLKIVGGFASQKDLIIQVFNADMIYGKNHIISAVEHAKRAIERKTNTTNSLEKEILLYASGERQLKLAIPKMGIKNGKGNVAIVLMDKAKNEISEKISNDLMKLIKLEREDKVLEGNEETLRKFGINETELKTVMKSKYGDLILEKVALVDIIK
jgi:KEOPS complex subunit Cgi121